MKKVIAMMKRKPGISKEEFKKYYEEKHSVLAAKHFNKYFLDYRRNYPSSEFLVDDQPLRGPAERAPQDEFTYDVITEFWYADRASMDEMFKAFKLVNDEIVADEAQFIDRSTLRVFIADETQTDLAKYR